MKAEGFADVDQGALSEGSGGSGTSPCREQEPWCVTAWAGRAGAEDVATLGVPWGGPQ